MPFTISWSAVVDPAGINGYNWQVSASSSFTPLIRASSTRSDQTQAIVSGLPNATYFWRVQAASGAGEQGAWSAPRTFTVTGAGPETPGTPVLAPLPYTTFHPWESIHFDWGVVPDAITYRLEISTDPSFPLTNATFWNDNIPKPSDGFNIGPASEGQYFARVFAVKADHPEGIRSLPSNVVQYSVFYNNPVQAPPSPTAPPNNAMLTLPVTLAWTHMPIPQPMGYDVQVSGNSNFSTNEVPTAVQLTEPTTTLLSLTSGTKFWRVRSTQGMCTPLLPCFTAWSPAQTFTISTLPPIPVSILPYQLPVQIPLPGGTQTGIAVQLTAAVPQSGATIALLSSRPDIAPVPPTITMQGNHAWTQFLMTLGQVSVPTVVTLTATLNGVSATNQFTVVPPALRSLTLTSATINGGAEATAWAQLDGPAPAGGALVSLSSNSAAASVPPTVTIPEGFWSAPIQIQTSQVTTDTIATITASYQGRSEQAQLKVSSQNAVPTSLTLFPSTVVGGVGSSTGSFDIVPPATAFDRFVGVTSNNPTVLPFLSTMAVVPAFSTRGSFSILHRSVTVPTVVTLSVSAGGVTHSAALTVNPEGTPPPAPLLTSYSVSPSSVSGGTPATGTVRLASAAPAGGTVVSLSSNLPGSASVPPSVTVPAGATSASFTVTTFLVAPTTVQLTARLGDTILFAPITINSPASAVLSAVAVNPASVVGGNASTGTVTLSAATPSAATISLSDNSSAVTVPSSVTVPAGSTSASFSVTTTSVTASTSAVITAVYGGVTQTAALTVTPASGGTPSAPSLLSPAGGATVSQPVTLDWSDVANAATYEVQVDSSSTIAAPFIANPTVTDSRVTLSGLPAQRLWWRVRARNAAGAAGPFSATRRFTPQAAPAAASLSSLSVSPASVVGPASATGTATLSTAAPAGGALVTLSSNNAAASVPASVTVAAGATSATFPVTTNVVTASIFVTLTGAYGGTTRTTTLGVTPVPPPASLNTLALSPTSVTAGNSSSGTVSLTSAAPPGGALVSLSSNMAGVTVPASVTVAAGASTAGFTVATSSGTTGSGTITATYGGSTRSATLTVNPPGAAATLTVTATGRSGERISSSPAGISVSVGSTGPASFNTGTSLTLSVSNGRDAIWSGACSSGGNKRRSCTFTINGNASVTGNVQ